MLTQNYQMDCYFRQSWIDKRLVFRGNGTPDILPVSITFLDRIWRPDTHFFNGMKSYLHVVTSANKLLRINRNGRILYSMR
jgi:gamma-aminobutyric acid receptor subunit alpha